VTRTGQGTELICSFAGPAYHNRLPSPSRLFSELRGHSGSSRTLVRAADRACIFGGFPDNVGVANQGFESGRVPRRRGVGRSSCSKVKSCEPITYMLDS